MTCVYWICHPDHSDIFTEGYIGITEDFAQRMRKHKNKITNAHLMNAINKYGWDNLIKKVLLIASVDYCLEIEKKLRPNKDIGWNIAIGGGKPVGWEKGQKLPNWIKEKISKGKTGKIFSDEHKSNLSKAKIGVIGSKCNNFKGPIKATNIKTKKIIILNGAKEMEQIGLHDSAVYRCIKGKQPSHKGYVFERLLI